MTMQHHDTRPAFARWIWRDRTQEHWVYSFAVDVVSSLMSWGAVLGLAYVTMDWWVPAVFGFVCGQVGVSP